MQEEGRQDRGRNKEWERIQGGRVWMIPDTHTDTHTGYRTIGIGMNNYIIYIGIGISMILLK